jgi:uncharacterized protein
MKVLIAGASGLLGRAFFAALKEDRLDVFRLVRTKPVSPDELGWSPAFGNLDPALLVGFDVVINFCGASIADGRWTDTRRKELRSSRIDATQTLAKAVKAVAGKGGPRVFVNASASGYYGDRGSLELTESSSAGSGFLAGLCADWESAALDAAGPEVRVVLARLGMVLANGGGALSKMAPVYRAGMGGHLGDGRQWMPWVAVDDAVGAIRFCLDHPEISGPVNVVSPESVTNAGFDRAMARIFGRQLSMPMPRFFLRLMYGKMADEALLASARVLPKKLLEAGYAFRYPSLEDALYEALAMEKDED